jgi:hypothetical protein
MTHQLYLDESLPEPTGDEAEPQIYQNRIAAGAAFRGWILPDYLSCHPKTWESMDEKAKESFVVVGTIPKPEPYSFTKQD